MKKSATPCDANRIAAFVHDQLPAAEEVILEEHLNSCQECRQRLHELSADHELWEKAANYLQQDADRSSEQLALNRQENDEAIDSLPVELGGDIQQILDWLAPTDDPRMLGRVAGYEVLGVVGSGGMGVVLKALDPGLNRVVAIKVLAPHLATSGTARKRFAREAQAAAAITHDNVIDIYSVSEFKGLPYLVMPYGRGPSLQKRLDENGPLQLEEILRIGYQIASGLAAAHGQGLIHRDIKPANILLCDDVDRLLITDFGLARTIDDSSVTRTGAISGTPQYMSPEQARGEHLDARSDLFSLGSLLYALCTGRVPFRAESNYGVLHKIMNSQPHPIRQLNPALPDWLVGIIDKLIAKRPADRYQTAEKVSEVLKRSLAHVQDPTSIPPPAKRDFARPLRVGAGKLTSLVAAILLFSLLAITYGYPLSPRSTPSEQKPTDEPSSLPSNAALLKDGVDDNDNGRQSDSTELDVASETAADWLTRKHLEVVIAAIHSYADDHKGLLPPAAIPNVDLAAERRLSGLVLLLPYFGVKPTSLDESRWREIRSDDPNRELALQTYHSIDLKKAWDDPVNQAAARTVISVFLMPNIGPSVDDNGRALSHIALVRGYGSQNNGAFPMDQQVALYGDDKSVGHISDGTSLTLAVGQISQQIGPWIAAGSSTSRTLSHPTETHPFPNFGGPIHDTAYFARCDGSLAFIDLAGSNSRGLQALATRAGGDSDSGDVRVYQSVAQYHLSSREASH